MREVAAFVPFGQDHLAAVVAVPDEPARAVAVLSAVPGSPRSHRHQLWARAAVLLAERGVASVRWEYRGLDDSTGSADHVSMAVTPVDQVLAVARFAQRASGTERVIGVGNCMGAQAALSLAAEMEECAGAVCILPHVVKPGRIRALVRRSVRSHGDGGGAGRRYRRAVSSAIGRFGLKVRAPVRDPLPAALAHGPVLFLYDQEHLKGRSRAFPKIRTMIDRLPAQLRRRFELRILPSYGLDRFGTVRSQELTLEAILGWVDRCLADHGSGDPWKGVAGEAGRKVG